MALAWRMRAQVRYLLLFLVLVLAPRRAWAWHCRLLPTELLRKVVVAVRGGSTLDEVRQTSDLIQDLSDPSVDSLESQELRLLISQRANEFVQGLLRDDSKLPEPKKLLHFLAPKIPAIKHSPDVALRIQSARSDIDSGVAACLIGMLAHVCELYEQASAGRVHKKRTPVAEQLVADRRFEQLIECVLCGVDVKKRKDENMRLHLEKTTDSEESSIEDMLDEEDARIDEGLSVRDSCRAAWGIAVLGVNKKRTLGGERIYDLLIALSLRVRELLLARLQSLRRDDLFIEGSELTIEERINALSQELAEDAASAIWVFACVRACTGGMRFAPLFDVCVSILCQNPIELRRKAQLDGPKYDSGQVGSNDAVERLARSEDDVEVELDSNATDQLKEESEGNGSVSVSESRDALIDYLSPKELTDVLWGVALHGSSQHDSSRDEAALSETVAVFREVAFDRLIEWLGEELVRLRSYNECEPAPDTDVTVEVVDAAALLEAERAAAKAEMASVEIENMTIQDSGGVQHVRVIDAAAIMASSTEHEGPIEVESIVLSDSLVEKEGIPPTASDRGYPERHDDSKERRKPFLRIFTPHDLCSIAWSITELHDPLQSSVCHLVAETLALLGRSSLDPLLGGDLSNLVWAITKSLRKEAQRLPDDAEIVVSEWIADYTVTGAEGSPLNKLHPPELGRLVWALTATKSLTSLGRDHPIRRSLRTLAVDALLAASTDLALFGAEDLGRILWGFLEVDDIDELLQRTLVTEALGRVLSTVEIALLDWENCMHYARLDDTGVSSKESTRFASFFGRTRFQVPLLEQRLDEGADENDDLSLLLVTKKSTLPLLRDLPLDPSTLCKVACSFVKLRKTHPEVYGAENIARVALRLLTSRNGRLLRECPLQDLVRLLEALATSDLSLGRERISLFVRRVVHLLNESPLQASAEMRPKERARLLWALGALGVKYCPSCDDVDSAHRRLQLVTEIPLVDSDELGEISDQSLTKLVSGMVTTELVLSKKQYTVDILQAIQSRIAGMKSTSFVCDLTETIASLHNLLLEESCSQEVATVEQLSNETRAGDNNEEEEEEETLNEGVADVDPELKELCDAVLSSLSRHAATLVESIRPVEMQRLLSVFALSPFQTDELVSAIEGEVERRLSKLHQTGPDLRDRLARCAVQADRLRRNDAGSPLDAIRDGLRSIFGRHKHDESVDDASENLEGEDEADNDNLEQIDETLGSIVELAAMTEEVEAATTTSIGRLTQNAMEGAFFELGRCRELIAHYRRIDFQSGKRETRYDHELRRSMAKRVLSRLLP